MKVDYTTWMEVKAIFESVGFTCTSYYCGAQKNCSELYSKMSYVKVVLDDTVYWIPPEGYTQAAQNEANFTCMLAINSGALSAAKLLARMLWA